MNMSFRFDQGISICSNSKPGVIDLTGAFGEWNYDVANVTRPNTPTNNNISQCNDLNGTGRNVSAGTDANRPVWNDSTPDYGAYDTGGTTFKRLFVSGLGALFSHYEWTFAIVCQVDTAANHTLFATANSANGRGGLTMSYNGGSATRRLSTIRESDGNLTTYDFGNAPVGTKELLVCRVVGTGNGVAATAVTARVNGVTQAGSGSLATNTVSANGLIQHGGTSATGASRIWYVKGWNRALSDASIASQEQSLAAAYGITL